ncbi:hypothetical protein [Thiocapsa imhoffii]|nr:hypothetical protein [Thiocapsa imhoffii]
MLTWFCHETALIEHRDSPGPLHDADLGWVELSGSAPNLVLV